MHSICLHHLHPISHSCPQPSSVCPTIACFQVPSTHLKHSIPGFDSFKCSLDLSPSLVPGLSAWLSLLLFISAFVIMLFSRDRENWRERGCFCGDEAVGSLLRSQAWILRRRYRTRGLVLRVRMEMASYSNGSEILFEAL